MATARYGDLQEAAQSVGSKGCPRSCNSTESQLKALERATEQKQAHGEIESYHPGYLGALDYDQTGFSATFFIP